LKTQPNDVISDEAVFEAVRTVARRMYVNVEPEPARLAGHPGQVGWMGGEWDR